MNQQLHPHPDAASPARPARSLFLHGMWRSGSTYVWSRFREAARTYCYYEPLAPGLHRLTHPRIARATPQAMARNRHPALDQPYFAEFAPLLGRRRGVPGFRRDLTFDRYAMSPDEEHPVLDAYISRLAGYAHGRDRIGVFGFNQAGLRIGWLASTFDSYNIQVERDPTDVWASYMEHLGRGNFTYFRNWLLIVERNADHPLFAPLAAQLPIRRGAARLIRAKRFYAEASKAMTAEQLYLLVVYLWLAHALHALSTCQLIIDTGLAGRPGYGFHLAARLAGETGLQLDFTTLRSPRPACDVLPPRRAARIEQDAAALFPRGSVGGLFLPSSVPMRAGELTARKADLLALVV